MDADEALARFLRGSLAGRARARFLGLAGTRAFARKVSAAISHALEEAFDPRAVVDDLPEEAWDSPGWLWKGREEGAVPVSSLREAYDSPWADRLVISEDGRFGFHRAEDYLDSELLLVARDGEG